jgi:hypothetical protein
MDGKNKTGDAQRIKWFVLDPPFLGAAQLLPYAPQTQTPLQPEGVFFI